MRPSLQDPHLFQIGETLLLLTIERQTILVNGQIAGFVEVLFDREHQRSEARIWLYPQFRPHIAAVRRWIERMQGGGRVSDVTPPNMEIVVYSEDAPPPASETLESVWGVGMRADRSIGFELFLTDLITGFVYPVHTSKNRRLALKVKREIEEDLLILSANAFARKWGLQRLFAQAK